jgi:hypothetical protein
VLSPEQSRFLSAQNARRFRPALPVDDWRAELDAERTAASIEILWVEQLREAVAARAADAPTTPAEFVAWFEQLRVVGPGQGDRLFPFLAEHATREQLRWFIGQEAAGEAGFEDLLALTQIAFDTRAKLEMARNFWDEMGRGNEDGMHGPMLGACARELDVDSIAPIAPAIEVANLMTALARHRRYSYHSIGALGVIELTAPTRTVHVHAGLERVGISADGARYFLIHSNVDIRHSRAWNAEVIAPLVERRPEVAPAIAEGALLRLEAGARCFAAYRAMFAEQGVAFAS